MFFEPWVRHTYSIYKVSFALLYCCWSAKLSYGRSLSLTATRQFGTLEEVA